MTSEHKAAEADDIEELLPWHAAGTLSRRDAERVEAALARDPELARRYELVREELGATIHLNETLGAPSARAMQELFAKIDAEPRRQRVSLGLGARIAEFFAGLTPRTLACVGGGGDRHPAAGGLDRRDGEQAGTAATRPPRRRAPPPAPAPSRSSASRRRRRGRHHQVPRIEPLQRRRRAERRRPLQGARRRQSAAGEASSAR